MVHTLVSIFFGVPLIGSALFLVVIIIFRKDCGHGW